ncbi:hypothetical protein MAHJHV35_48290 [Mycobacterium avium subsp. hominissuis]
MLCDVRQDRLTTATAALAELGMTPTAVNCDVTDRRAVAQLFDTAAVNRSCRTSHSTRV